MIEILWDVKPCVWFGVCFMWLRWYVVRSFDTASNINWATQRYISQVTDIGANNNNNNK
jgi:hypothetical protein